jgi:hypothetical protein
MVPSDHRLDHVAARLIERLEGSRRSWTGASVAEIEASRIAREHVGAATVELREVLPGPEGAAHAAFLEKEIASTVLPRYLELARRFNTSERSNYGFRALGEPIGRAVMAVGALLVTWFAVFRFIEFPEMWPVIPVLFSVPIWPDLAAWAGRRRQAQQLQALVDDTARIQNQADVYVPLTSSEIDPPSRLDDRRRAAQRDTEH